MLESVNGVLFTGGDANLTYIDKETGEEKLSNFTLRARQVVKHIHDQNLQGNHFPLLGICQGPQVVLMAISKDVEIIDDYDHKKQYDYLKFENYARQSRMFSKYSDELFDRLENEKVMYFEHSLGIAPKKVTENEQLNEFFEILATSTDSYRRTFIAALEGKKYPFYLVQYHPEFVFQEPLAKGELDREGPKFKAIQGIAKLLVEEAAKNKNHFDEDNERLKKFDFSTGERVYFDTKWSDVYFYRNGDVYKKGISFDDYHMLRRLRLA